MSNCFVEPVSEVRKGGGRDSKSLSTVACLLSFDLLPQVSWRLDEQKGQSEGNLQSVFSSRFSLFVLLVLSLWVQYKDKANCGRHRVSV